MPSHSAGPSETTARRPDGTGSCAEPSLPVAAGPPSQSGLCFLQSARGLDTRCPAATFFISLSDPLPASEILSIWFRPPSGRGATLLACGHLPAAGPEDGSRDDRRLSPDAKSNQGSGPVQWRSGHPWGGSLSGSCVTGCACPSPFPGPAPSGRPVSPPRSRLRSAWVR